MDQQTISQWMTDTFAACIAGTPLSISAPHVELTIVPFTPVPYIAGETSVTCRSREQSRSSPSWRSSSCWVQSSLIVVLHVHPREHSSRHDVKPRVCRCYGSHERYTKSRPEEGVPCHWTAAKHVHEWG